MIYLILGLLGIVLGTLIYYKLLKPAKYWKERDVVYEPSWPIVGNMLQIVFRQKHPMEISIDLYNKYPKERYVGYMLFLRPVLLLRDLDLIKQLTIKDFDYFHSHNSFVDTDTDPVLSKGLVILAGDEWRKMRATLSPVFTSSKMRNMYPLITQCAKNVVAHFQSKEIIAIEMKDIASRFTTDVIATTAFGIHTDSLAEPRNNFFTTGQRLGKLGFIHFLKLIILLVSSKAAAWLGIQIIPREISEFFRGIVEYSISKREKEGIIRPDLIHLLMEARKGESKQEDTGPVEGFAAVDEYSRGKITQQLLTDECMAAQAMLFFLAGFDTTSTALSFTAYELAVNPNIQRKLQLEIDTANQKCEGTIHYETLLAMKYLDQVVSESLRLWPPGPETDRVCNKDYNLTPSSLTDKSLLIEKGTSIMIPIAAIHRDPHYYPEPERFDPDRFSDENRSKIVPGSYLPFGVGPRNCIGSRFAILQLKSLCFHLLSKFDIVALNDTPIPLKISPKKFNLQPKNGFRLGLKPRRSLY